ncbi:MAG TPA: polysaccharide biosynthesis/export family protein [Pyrinomonadaceae bacterium]|nr:polysaccharide biosynthesis/export family protein [Pyrinomonadaceae bacterium]
MTKNSKLTALAIAALLVMTTAGLGSALAQTQNDPQKQRPRTTSSPQDKNKKPVSGDRLEPDDTTTRPSDVPDAIVANRQEQLSEEEAAINPYYNNFFSTYRLGPEDVISIEVFNQDRYTRKGITVPPSGRISLQLIPGGIFVNGKTPEEVARYIEKQYDEYIIDPQVTVTLEKAASYRYAILGDVLQPGVRLMNRRMTVTEAIAEAGGVLTTGDRSKVRVLRRKADGQMGEIVVNVSAIYKGKELDNVYLAPGDQVLVPGNKLKTFHKIMGFANVLSFARIFGLPVGY